MRLLNRLIRSRRQFRISPERAEAQSLAEVIPSCLLCGSALAGHDYALLATVVVRGEEDGDLARFIAAAKGRRWPDLREFQSWLGKCDNVEAYALRCSGRVLLAVVMSPFDLLQSDHLVHSEALSVQESASLAETFTGLQWHPF
jgi:hypothetical protein